MTNINLKSLMLIVSIMLSACGGGNTQSISPVPEQAIKKTINVDNLDQTFAVYLLYHYRLTREINLLSQFTLQLKFESGFPENELRPCPLGGSFQGLSKIDYYACQANSGTITSGSIEKFYFYGPSRALPVKFVDLNYQLLDDTELQKLSGMYTYAYRSNSFNQLSSFDLKYVHGERTESYLSDTQKQGVAHLRTTSSIGNRSFQVIEYDDQQLPIAPVLSTDDGANITIAFDNAGAATLSLRNEKNGSVITNKVYSNIEVEKLLKTERKAKS